MEWKLPTAAISCAQLMGQEAEDIRQTHVCLYPAGNMLSYRDGICYDYSKIKITN